MEDTIITDTVQAHQIEDGDQIVINDDYLENVKVLDDEDNIIISGFSNNTGGIEVYTLDPFDTINLWTV